MTEDHCTTNGSCGEDGADAGYGYIRNRAQILGRLKRIEGQVRGLGRMVDEGTYCIDILTQVSAATSALRSVALTLLADHLEHCVAHAIRTGDAEETEQTLAEASQAIARLVR